MKRTLPSLLIAEIMLQTMWLSSTFMMAPSPRAIALIQAKKSDQEISVFAIWMNISSFHPAIFFLHLTPTLVLCCAIREEVMRRIQAGFAGAPSLRVRLSSPGS
jgi:hypothetical protein